MELIFCAGKNRTYAEIAVRAGFLSGARLPCTVYFQPFFVDQEYMKPDRAAYVDVVRVRCPYMATVLDWSPNVPLVDVLAWAEDIAPYVQEVILIPKIPGGVERLPRVIGGRSVRLGYSVATTYGATSVQLQEFRGWPVHLLGGDPARQMALARLSWLNVVSVDGNKWMLQAASNQVWVADLMPRGAARNRRWPQLQELGLGHIRERSCYAAFELSCVNILTAWKMQTATLQLPLM